MKNSIQFSSRSEGVELCKQENSKKNWMSRKIFAIRKSLVAGVFKTIYHIALAFFQGLPKAVIGDISYLKSYIRKVAQDLQEAYAWITILFWDKTSLENQDIPNRENILSALEDPSSTNAGLKDITLSVNSKINISSLFQVPHNDEEKKVLSDKISYFNKEGIQKAIYRKQLNDFYLFEALSNDQLKDLDISRLTEDQINYLFPVPDNLEQNRLLAERMSNFKREVIQKALYQGKLNSYNALQFISNAQLEGLDISRLKRDQIDNLFPSPENYKQIQLSIERMGLFKKTDIQKALYDKSLTWPFAILRISNDQLQDLDLSRLNEDQIRSLFPQLWCKRESDAVRKRFLGCNSIGISNAFKKGLMPGYLQEFIPK